MATSTSSTTTTTPPPSQQQQPPPTCSTTTTALVSFLRMEADIAEERAKKLRYQANELSRSLGLSSSDGIGGLNEIEALLEYNPHEMAPINPSTGLPKYKGKKRGRKPKIRKRPRKSINSPKRQHTAYTLFVQETYPGVRANHPELQSKDVITIVARMWKKDVGVDEKEVWKERAKACGDEEEDGVDEEHQEDEEEEESGIVEGEEEHDEEEEEEDGDAQGNMTHVTAEIAEPMSIPQS